MHGEMPLITTVVAGLGLAFVLGALANRLKIPPIVGYLLAGVVVGPATPGPVVDMALANELAEIGVILLMFGVGLHFSLNDLMSVKAIAIPGAVVQIAIATLLGMGLAFGLGWNVGAGLVFGLALSVASTVVLLRALQERRLIDTERGRIAVGWLIVEDLAMVLALVLLPPLAQIGSGESSALAGIAATLALTVAKVAAFVVLMLLIGRRLIPAILHSIAHSGSRELFRLAVLAIALGVAFGAAELFDVSFALGAFFAGMIMSESQLSQRAAEETLPLRDAFAVLFFVSVGMLFNPATIIEQPLSLLAVVIIVVIGKSLAAYGIVRVFGHPHRTALTISASLAQIGEFSFILAALGLELGLLPAEGRDLILAAAILSILLNPLAFLLVDRSAAAAQAAASKEAEEANRLVPTKLHGHAIVVGYGRVGRRVADHLARMTLPVLVVEDAAEAVAPLRQQGGEAIIGNAVRPEILAAAGLPSARAVVVAIPDPFEAGQIVQQARAADATLPVVARAHSDADVEHLKKMGASAILMGEEEIARGMIGWLDALDGGTRNELTADDGPAAPAA